MAEVCHQTDQLGPNSVLEEQIFLNHVVLEGICKYLSTQDLLRTSLLSQAWFIESRKALTNSKRRHAVCIQIDYHSPCRTLVKFNDFLEETLRTTDHPIIFNGIKLRFNGQSYNWKYKCHDCLRNSWLAGAGWNNEDAGQGLETGRRWRDEHDQLIMDKLPEIFGNILGKMEFKYIHLDDGLTWYCPFAVLVKWWIRERSESILELHFSDTSTIMYIDSAAYVIFNALNINKVFPNLEVMGVDICYGEPEVFGLSSIVAPSLQKVILNYPDWDSDPASKIFEFPPNFPRHAVTNLKTVAHKVSATIALIEEFHPKIQVLELDRKINQNLLIWADLFYFGRLVSATLKNLTCSSSILAFLVCGKNNSMDCESMIQNRFPVLKILELHSSVGADGSNWFKCIDFSHVFPTLEAVQLELVEIDSGDDGAVAYYGPDNPQTIANVGAEFIQNLSLKTTSNTGQSVRCAIKWLTLISNISHLDLKGMPFIYDGDDGAFRRLFGKVQTLEFLKEISISAADLRFFCLDDLILGVHSQTKERLREMNLERLLVYTSSFLDHTGLQKINIHGKGVCTQRLNDAGIRVCKSNQTPDTFLVSSEIAKLICKLRPGFKFCLEIFEACSPKCTSGFRPGGLRLEHLEPFAKISTQQPPGIKFKRVWEIQFLNENRASKSYCSIQLD